MELSPLVSVIIPMYNVEKYISDTLESVLNQTYKNLEIIIIDDGSTDKSVDIVTSFKDKFNNIQYIYQKNSGVSSARNKGIYNAKGEYIAFLDSDDLWEKTKIEKQMYRILNTGAGACYCGYIEYINGRIRNKLPKSFFEEKALIPVLMKKTEAFTSTWLIKKDIIVDNNILFTENCHWAEDLEFFLKILSITKVSAVKEYLAVYRIRSNSLSTFTPNQMSEIEIWLRFIEWIRQNKRLLLYEEKEVVDFVYNITLPSITVDYIFKSLVLGYDITSFLDKYQLNSHVARYKPNISFNSLKVLIKRMAIEHRVVLKMLSFLFLKKNYNYFHR
ncbi:MAG: glycosyl transferase family 2 [Caloramator sp.]|jgi:glycosyltransferase involved in cell wall biosynthesis|uniref:glycosyltransferase family 2 protein n=1 Tax=Caloramator sp. TaxID=1871330 RepID=UPI001D93041B|nr:glycosyltransferase family A protein [Caloramator sp.]MBZ4664696.1 glycosyl transferase family 2 [Caloramator sp.]